MAEDMNFGPVRLLNEELMYRASADEGLKQMADLIDEMFEKQAARIARIEADHAKWGAQIEKVLADTNALIKELAADLTGGR